MDSTVLLHCACPFFCLNIHVVRIDPLTEDGAFDTEFFGSNEYNRVRARVEWYIKQEGFDTTPGEHVMCLLDRYWLIQVTPFENS